MREKLKYENNWTIFLSRDTTMRPELSDKLREELTIFLSRDIIMRPELSDKLREKYPRLYSNMRGRTIECPDGWYNLLDTYSNRIMEILNKYEPIDKEGFLIVKSKFGELRIQGIKFDFSGGPDPETDLTNIEMLISECESESKKTCDRCGSPAKIEKDNLWNGPTCDSCKEAIKLKKMLR